MKTLIMNRLHCSEKQANIIVADLQKLSPALQPLLDAWIENGACNDDTLYNGHSLNTLCRDYGLHFTGALLTLDWLIKEPEKAAKALAEPIR